MTKYISATLMDENFLILGGNIIYPYVLLIKLNEKGWLTPNL